MGDLAEDEGLRYKFMNAFDRGIMHLDKAFGFMGAPHEYTSRKDEGDKLIVAEKGDLVMVFNFHHTNSYTDYKVGTWKKGPYKVGSPATRGSSAGTRTSLSGTTPSSTRTRTAMTAGRTPCRSTPRPARWWSTPPPSSATRTTRRFRAWASRATGRTSATEGADTRRPGRPRHRWASAALSRKHCAASSLLGQPPHFIFFQLSNTLHPPPPPLCPCFFFFFFFSKKKKKKKKS